MQQQPFNLQHFQRAFVTERDCEDHLFRLRWPDGYLCPRCGHRKHSFHRTRRLYQCSGCKYQVSVTAGTVFHKTKTPLLTWFWMIFLMTRPKSGVSMMSLQRMLGIRSYKTAWTMGHKIRKAMSERDGKRQLAGLVEIGSGLIGGLKTSRRSAAGTSGATVVVSVEHSGVTFGFAALKHIPSPTSTSDMGARGRFRRRSTHTVRRNGCDRGASEGFGERSSGERAETDGSRSPRWTHVLISNLRGILRGVHHGVSEKHLHRYLGEFSYRFNRRFWDSELFDRAVQACLGATSVTFAELTHL